MGSSASCATRFRNDNALVVPSAGRGHARAVYRQSTSSPPVVGVARDDVSGQHASAKLGVDMWCTCQHASPHAEGDPDPPRP